MKTLALLGLSVLAVACADTVTTPQRFPTKPTLECRSGYIIVDGRSVCADSGGGGGLAPVSRPDNPRQDSLHRP